MSDFMLWSKIVGAVILAITTTYFLYRFIKKDKVIIREYWKEYSNFVIFLILLGIGVGCFIWFKFDKASPEYWSNGFPVELGGALFDLLFIVLIGSYFQFRINLKNEAERLIQELEATSDFDGENKVSARSNGYKVKRLIQIGYGNNIPMGIKIAITLNQSEVCSVNFNSIDLSGSIFDNCTDFRNICWKSVKFDTRNLTGAKFQSSILSGHSFQRCCLKEASFKESYLKYVDFSSSYLLDTDFRGATIATAGFQFRNAYLEDAIFIGVVITNDSGYYKVPLKKLVKNGYQPDVIYDVFSKRISANAYSDKFFSLPDFSQTVDSQEYFDFVSSTWSCSFPCSYCGIQFAHFDKGVKEAIIEYFQLEPHAPTKYEDLTEEQKAERDKFWQECEETEKESVKLREQYYKEKAEREAKE